jgi:tetratricopeptide (TPR) repeat protein
MSGCCSNMICNGCDFANTKRENEAGLKRRCAFCREPVPESEEEYDKNVMERIKKNDPVALREEGIRDCNVGDYKTAIKYLTKAAELGDAIAHFYLSCSYRDGEGVNKDAEKEFHHMEQAAIGGHPIARHNLGCMEAELAGWSGRYERAKKHFIIAASLGFEDSLKNVKDLYAHGDASKEDYAAALCAYQAATEEAKSAEREAAEAYYKDLLEEL